MFCFLLYLIVYFFLCIPRYQSLLPSFSFIPSGAGWRKYHHLEIYYDENCFFLWASKIKCFQYLNKSYDTHLVI